MLRYERDGWVVITEQGDIAAIHPIRINFTLKSEPFGIIHRCPFNSPFGILNEP